MFLNVWELIGEVPIEAAAFWDDSSSRIVLASDVTENSSIVSVNTYAALEIGNLWVNDAAGQSEVIAVSGGERVLNNITVDGGSFWEWILIIMLYFLHIKRKYLNF